MKLILAPFFAVLIFSTAIWFSTANAENKPVVENTKSETVAVSALPLVLVGTVVGLEPENSFGAVRFTKTEKRGNFAPQAKIEALAKVESVERDKLIIRNSASGKLEYLRTGAFDPKQRPSAKAIQSSITKEFQIERKAVDSALADLPAILSSARLVPVVGNDGKVIGYKIDFFNPGSVFETLGLKAGDLLKSVNGTDFSGAPFELFTQLKSSSLMKLNIERGAKPIVVTYLIR